MTKPFLSLCVIAKNESTNLQRCLASVAGLVDEMVVTDTGSTDDTVAIAQAAGAKVNHFEWCDDFSAAYNQCLDHASGEWVLLIDADEELAPTSRDEVRQLIKREDAFAYTVLRQDFYGDGQAFSEMLQTRLFRLRDGVRFIGRIHQQFEPTLSEHAANERRLVLDSPVRIKHYGYVGDYKSRKLDRAIRLLELELEARPDRFYYLVELGRSKLASKDSSGVDALRRAAELVATGVEPVDPRSASLAMLLEELLATDVLPNNFPLTMQRAEQIAIDCFSDSIPLLWQRALKRFKANDFAESARLLERILTLSETGAYSRLCSFQPEIMGPDALLNLGVCYVRLTRFQEAAQCFERLKDDPKHRAGALQNLKAIAHLRRRN